MSTPLAVLLKLRPAPKNLSESRSILRTLQSRFGRVNTFIEPRHLGKSHNYIFAIFADKAAYDKALASSPISITASTQPPSLTNKTADPKTTWMTDHAKQFQCEIESSNFDHTTSVQRNPFYGPYEVARSSIAYQTIRQQDPPDRALADYQMQHRDIIYSKKKEELLKRSSFGKGGMMGLWRQVKAEATGESKPRPTEDKHTKT
ncbi:putative nad h-dependent d-xylose reductase xyl1 [Phaeomoniella chlamydospora]|uniref:Putative nad h-dependent d-xylose reductase xyl1 n=1 Tax=Phaeomoniella chlamydospora TaxID=158046 RepID=A0A0G2EZH7_PHACM|nr:putative nad h-dependent d-xylose reductase xyl1 [Phaeomoniella chlamydospora]